MTKCDRRHYGMYIIQDYIISNYFVIKESDYTCYMFIPTWCDTLSLGATCSLKSSRSDNSPSGSEESVITSDDSASVSRNELPSPSISETNVQLLWSNN